MAEDSCTLHTPYLLEMAPDLTTEEGVKEYLKGTRFASRQIVALSGGNVNFVYRAELDKPHSGRRTVVVKHAQSHVKIWSNVPFDTTRQVLVATTI